MPPARGPFELVLWENACYLLPDERRAAVFAGLRKQVGLTPKAILKADADILLALATLGGMRPKVRVFRWQEIARITESQFGGDLDTILTLPYTQAKKALKQFPNIGDPGAEKILMYCGAAPGLPLGVEWSAGAYARRVRPGAEELWRRLPVRAGGHQERTATQGRGYCPGASLAAPARKRDLPGQESPML